LPPYQRLNLALITFSAALLAANAYHIALMRPVAALVAAGAAGMSAAVPAYFYSMSLPKTFTMAQLMRVRLIYQRLFQSKTRLGAPSLAEIMDPAANLRLPH
jgi:hypothetical protein